jgi:hypothetical protein
MLAMNLQANLHVNTGLGSKFHLNYM